MRWNEKLNVSQEIYILLSLPEVLVVEKRLMIFNDWNWKWLFSNIHSLLSICHDIDRGLISFISLPELLYYTSSIGRHCWKRVSNLWFCQVNRPHHRSPCLIQNRLTSNPIWPETQKSYFVLPWRKIWKWRNNKQRAFRHVLRRSKCIKLIININLHHTDTHTKRRHMIHVLWGYRANKVIKSLIVILSQWKVWGELFQPENLFQHLGLWGSKRGLEDVSDG